jgi:hypothetical protein
MNDSMSPREDCATALLPCEHLFASSHTEDEVICALEELLHKAQVVARRIEEQVWRVMEEEETSEAAWPSSTNGSC